MTAAQAAKLREAFPHVQRVTKKWKDKAGQEKSITLDYIGHAVVTDRLLSVDPDWSFEPLLDGQGFPIVVTQGLAPGDTVGVWGRLTVLGTSVVEFCSDSNLVNAYSRCLCRCAMRRGVALDLWIKGDGKDLTGSGGNAGDVAGEPSAATRGGSDGGRRPGSNPGVAASTSAASPALKPPTGPRGSKAKPTAEQLAEIDQLVTNCAAVKGESDELIWTALAASGFVRDELTEPQAVDLLGRLQRWEKSLTEAVAKAS